MLDLCQVHARNIVEITRQLVVLLDNMAENKPKLAKDNYANMLKVLEENERNKATFLNEVASVGSLLISREDFLRLLFRLGEVAEYCEAMGYRLMGMVDMKWKLDKKRLETSLSMPRRRSRYPKPSRILSDRSMRNLGGWIWSCYQARCRFRCYCSSETSSIEPNELRISASTWWIIFVFWH